MPRPIPKFKKVPKPKRAPYTREELAERAMARTEQRMGLSVVKVNNAIVKHRGLIEPMARELNVPHATLRRYIEKNEVCNEMRIYAREAMGDIAEQKLYDLIEAGDVRCILYYLSTVHAKRGYAMNGGGFSTGVNGQPVLHVDTVNIIGVPSGTFLPRDVKDGFVIDQPPSPGAEPPTD